MAPLLCIERSPGLADILRGSHGLAEALRPTPESNLYVLPAGQAKPEEIGGLLTKPMLDTLLGSLRQKFDGVFLDAPAIGLYPDDTAAIARSVGDALVVVRMHKTRRDVVVRTLRLLRSWGATPAGLVLTGR